MSPPSPSVRAPVVRWCALVLASALVAGCTSGGPEGAEGSSEARGGAPVVSLLAGPDTASALPRRGVPVDTLVAAETDRGTLERVVVRPRGEDPLEGSLTDGGRRWRAEERLAPGTVYAVRIRARDAEGHLHTTARRFRTERLSLDELTYPSIAPLDGETVGVGMPVVVQFDVPVTDRASIEEHLRVESVPRQTGSWHWISDRQVRWRPRDYWKPGTEVTVHATIRSVAAGDGVYGQVDREVGFTVGERVVHRIDVRRHELTTYVGGRALRTMPVSAGKPGFITRSGTKVVMEKHRTKTMDAATTGIGPGDPDYYRIEDVEYALRVTNSGEFIHAAPWSVGSQGSANVSHGCVGLSTADARWLYERTRRGDVVVVRGSDRQMTVENGWGDWSVPFREYRAGSALS